jgi:hypothetical protein
LELVPIRSLLAGYLWFLMSKTRYCAWKILGLVLQACVYACAGLWLYLSVTTCSSPSAFDAGAGKVIPFSCHGSVVFITRTQDNLIRWLIPALVVAGICGLAARKKAKRDINTDKAAE